MRSYIRDQFETIVVGIDKTDTETEHAWWETSSGAEFGAEVKEKLLHLLHLSWLAGSMGLADPYPPNLGPVMGPLPAPSDYIPVGVFCRHCRTVHGSPEREWPPHPDRLTCPKCNAKPGYPCLFENGQPRREPHAERK